MTRFHSEEYINFLSNAGHTHVTPPIKTLPSFNVGDDWFVCGIIFIMNLLLAVSEIKVNFKYYFFFVLMYFK